MKERLRDLKRLRWIICNGEGVPYDRFLPFVDAKRKATNSTSIESNKAGQNAGVEILKQEFGGTLIVPSETLVPDARFGLQQRAQLTRGEVAQVEDLELGGDSHTLWEVFVELIGFPKI